MQKSDIGYFSSPNSEINYFITLAAPCGCTHINGFGSAPMCDVI